MDVNEIENLYEELVGGGDKEMQAANKGQQYQTMQEQRNSVFVESDNKNLL